MNQLASANEDSHEEADAAESRADRLLSLGSGSCTSALKRGMYMPNASWRRWGVATAGRGVSPPLQRERSGSGKGVAQRRSAQAKRGRLGSGLRARGDTSP